MGRAGIAYPPKFWGSGSSFAECNGSRFYKRHDITGTALPQSRGVWYCSQLLPNPNFVSPLMKIILVHFKKRDITTQSLSYLSDKKSVPDDPNTVVHPSNDWGINSAARFG